MRETSCRVLRLLLQQVTKLLVIDPLLARRRLWEIFRQFSHVGIVRRRPLPCGFCR
jgi:hypothetical protein